MFNWFFPASRTSRKSTNSRHTLKSRPTIESLEERTVLSTVFVVPIAQPIDAEHRHFLNDALPLAGAGGTVVIEPGATPDSGTVNVSLANVTIQGDPMFSEVSLPQYDLNINANDVSLTNLNLGIVTVAATAHGVNVSSSQLMNFVETGAANGAGGNTLSHNRILGRVDLQGNSALLQPTADLVEFNEFISGQPVVLQLTNSNDTIVKNNHIVSDGASAVGIQVRSNSDQVTISGNTIEMLGGGSPIAMALINTGGAAGNILGAKVSNNVTSTHGVGKGLFINIFGTGVGMAVQIEGNDFVDNGTGVEIFGVTGSATGAGNVDLGGGSNAFGTSKGANNFRGYDGLNSHFAIYLHNTDANVSAVAQKNIFNNGATPSLVVRDGGNGGGTGMVDVSNALDSSHAYVQSLYLQLLGRAGDTSNGGEVDQWISVLQSKGERAVAKGILFSPESLNGIVDDLFVKYLDRNADATELAKYSKQLKSGANLTRVEASILGSVEFQSHISTNFVQSLYLDLLDRPATSIELAKGFSSLPTLGLKGLAAKTAGSKERRIDFAADLYSDLLHRDPVGDEASVLAGKSSNLLKLEFLVVSGDEFFNRG